MKVKDFVVTYLTSQTVKGMAVELIGSLGQTLNLAQTRYHEYNNLFNDKRLWTAQKEVSQCIHYPVARSKDGLYQTADQNCDQSVVEVFKKKLAVLILELKNLPKTKADSLIPSSFEGIFSEEKIYVTSNDRLMITLSNDYQKLEKVELSRFDFFSLGVFCYKDVVYYELVDENGQPLTETELNKHDVILILAQLLVFMTIAGITKHDYATMSTYFSIKNA